MRLNVRTGVLHQYPANEACNLDAAKHQAGFDHEKAARQHPKYKRDCKRCFSA